ncbi:MAG: radical SAM protein [Planctomycetes bacterium]|nr:radical SAM protein [Planctomycetota bacterium]
MIPLRNFKRNLVKSLKQPAYARKVLKQRMFSYLAYRLFNGYSSSPETLSLFLTNRCNLRCKMCGQWGVSGSSKRMSSEELKSELTLKEIKGIVDDVKAFKPNITLFGGEPLLYTNWDSVVSYIKRAGMRCNIITNGTLLEKNADSIFTCGVDEIIFSLDGPRDVHDEMRNADGTFDSAYRGLRLIRDTKTKTGSPKPIVNIACTIFETNYKYLNEIINVAEELKASTITFHHLIFLNRETHKQHNDIFNHHFGIRCEDWGGFVRESLPDIDVEYLSRKIAALRDSKRDIDVSFYPNFTHEEIKRYYTEFNFSSSSYRKRCLSPWMVSYIFPDGSVRPCQSQNFSAGNVRDGSFHTIWNNKEYKRYRVITKKTLTYPACSRCTELYRF